MALQIKDGNGAIQNEPLYDPSFRAAKAGMIYTTAKDIAYLGGSATMVVRLKQVRVTVVGTGAAGDLALILVKGSSLPTTSGTPLAMTAVPLDASSAAATAVAVNVQGASGTVTNCATATGYGTIGATSVGVNATGTIPSTSVFVWDFTNKGDQPPLLRLATECFTVRATNGGTTPTSATVDIEFGFEEGTT